MLVFEGLITALAGGVGAARFLSGLIKIVNQDETLTSLLTLWQV
jgi:2-phospho-L-lactate transferase/gluconeogenesis factor (CofD/UPF0052 family)